MSADRIAFWGLAPTFLEKSARDWSSRWTVNQTTDVHYDPAHVEISVLVPGFSWKLARQIAFWALLTAIGASGAIFVSSA